MKNLVGILALVAGVTGSAAADPSGIRNAHELYYGLATVTGVSPAEPELAAFFANVLGRLPKAGTIEEATPPMQFAFTNLAGLFCAKFIRQESIEMNPDRRLVHKEVDFLLDLNGFDADIAKATIDRYFRNFLGRGAYPEESTLALEVIGEYPASAGPKANLPELLGIICTTVASSPEFLLF